MPDGSVVEFPDSMSPDQINSALAGWKPGASATAQQPQASGQNNTWSRLPEMAGSALVKGTAALAGLPGDVINLARTGNNALNSVMGQGPTQYATPNLPTSAQTTGLTHSLGLTNRNDLTPTTPLERYGTAVLEAVPAIAATVASGGADAIPAIASGFASATAAQGAHDLAPDSRWTPVVAGLGAGLVGAGGINSVENMLESRAATRGVSDAADALTAAREASRTGKFDLDTGATNMKSASRDDFAAARQTLTDAADATKAGHDAAIQQVATTLGNSKTLQDAGQQLQAGARNWISQILPQKLGALWQPVDAAIPKDTKLGLPGFSSALGDINKSAGQLEPLAAILKPSAPKALGKAMDNVAGLGDLDPGSAPGQYSWGDVQKLRTTLGDAMSNPKVINDVGAQNLQRLYATLTSDMRGAAGKVSPQAGTLFDQANEGSKTLYQIGEGPMSRVVAGARPSADDPAPEAVAKGLLSGGKTGASDLQVLRQEIPQGVNELAAAHLNVNPGGFTKLAPEAQSALIPQADQSATVIGAQAGKTAADQARSDGIKLAQQQHQDNLAKIASDQKQGKFDLSSGVASSSAALRDAQARLTAVPKPAIGGHAMQGLFGTTLGNELGVLALKGMGLPGSDLVHGAVGSVAGASLPMAYRGLKSIAKNPNQLVYPGQGAVIGNALSPSSSQ